MTLCRPVSLRSKLLILVTQGILLVMPAMAMARTLISLRVVDAKTGQKLEAAEVRVNGTLIGKTNGSGFLESAAPGGKVTLAISHPLHRILTVKKTCPNGALCPLGKFGLKQQEGTLSVTLPSPGTVAIFRRADNQRIQQVDGVAGQERTFGLAPGRYLVRCSKPRFAPYLKDVTIADGATERVAATFHRSRHTLKLRNVSAVAAAVTINTCENNEGKSVVVPANGISPIVVPACATKIVFARPAHRPFETTVDVWRDSALLLPALIPSFDATGHVSEGTPTSAALLCAGAFLLALLLFAGVSGRKA